MTYLGYQQLTSLSSATALTIPTGAKTAVVIAETQSVRWRADGTDPTASVGMLIPTNTTITIENISSRLKFIETTASAKLNVSYYG